MKKPFSRLNKVLGFLALGSLVFCFNTPQNDEQKMQTIMVNVKQALSYLHYSPKQFDDKLSKEVYKKYLESLDPGKNFFTQEDLNEFAQHELKLDDYLAEGDLTFYKLSSERFKQRLEDLEKINDEILSQPINLEEDEEIILENKLKKTPANAQELRNEWKKYIKLSLLQEIESTEMKEQTRKELKDSLIQHKLKDTINLKITTLAEKQKLAIEELKSSSKTTFKRYKKRKAMDLFSRYINAYTMCFDPHSNYMSPQEKEDFDQQFKGQIIGIGAILNEKKGQLSFGTLVMGAPAWKSKQIAEGDKILKIKSYPDQQNLSMAGYLVEEAVKFIRGKKGTEVMITIQKKDGSIREVKMIREEVEIEETFAKSTVVEGPDGQKQGYILLPGFNADFENEKGRNASDDVKAELIKLKKANVKSIILDLRYNGGGSLSEAVDMMGLFIKPGPALQVKAGDGKISVLRCKGNEPVWEGPLVVMQNELSASASEIFAGLVQDYGRGVVIGSPQSFGKGTVQGLIPLNRFLNTNEDFGSIKLTTQRYYRITGNATQNKGVSADIAIPSITDFGEIGEIHEDFTMPWEQIKSAEFAPLSKPNIAKLNASVQARLSANKNYNQLMELSKYTGKINKMERLSLNMTKYFAQVKERREKAKQFKAIAKYKNSLKFKLNPEDEAKNGKDEARKKKQDNWIKGLQKDLYLEEAVKVAQDM
jgi:carboxyl-terminal processing protease